MIVISELKIQTLEHIINYETGEPVDSKQLEEIKEKLETVEYFVDIDALNRVTIMDVFSGMVLFKAKLTHSSYNINASYE